MMQQNPKVDHARLARSAVLLGVLGAACTVATIAFAEQALETNASLVGGYQFTSFDVPGAAFGTNPHDMNDRGVITGSYDIDASFTPHGFIRTPDGHLMLFEAPDGGPGIDPQGINEVGDVVGYYFDSNGNTHGFVRKRGGAIITFDVPFPNQGTIPQAINAHGVVVGYYFDANGAPQPFLRSPAGQISAVNPPGSIGGFGKNITDDGVMTGDFVDGNLLTGHGYLRRTDGSIAIFDAPGAGTGPNPNPPPPFLGTFVATEQGSNASDQITGEYSSLSTDGSTYIYHGYLRQRDGYIVSFDVPGNGVGNFRGVSAMSINSSGVICGFNVLDSNSGYAQGFVRHRDGSIVLIDAPAVGTGNYQGTFPAVINAPGTIAGYWLDVNFISHGFVMRPKVETP